VHEQEPPHTTLGSVPIGAQLAVHAFDPQVTVLFVQAWLSAEQMTSHAPLEHCTMPFRHACCAVHCTEHAWLAGQLMVAPWQLWLPVHCTSHAKPAGQLMVMSLHS
jgi:hypothetical protein